MNSVLMIHMYSEGCAEIAYDATREIPVAIFGDRLLMTFPFTVRAFDKWHARVLIDRVSGQVFQESQIIGTVSQDIPRNPLIKQTMQFPIKVAVAADSFAASEGMRSGKEPHLDFRLQVGLIEQFVKHELGRVSPEAPMFHTSTIQIRQKIPRDRWRGLLEHATLGSCFFLETLLPRGAAPDLASVAQTAYRHFLDGGSVGYQACVAEIRKGLEILKETHGVAADKFDDKPLRNRKHKRQERIELLFLSLHHYAHLSHHENDFYSQAEAQLALTMFVNLTKILQPRVADTQAMGRGVPNE